MLKGTFAPIDGLITIKDKLQTSSLPNLFYSTNYFVMLVHWREILAYLVMFSTPLHFRAQSILTASKISCGQKISRSFLDFI